MAEEFKHWEYRVQTVGGVFSTKDEDIQAMLDEWGAEGWEAVDVTKRVGDLVAVDAGGVLGFVAWDAGTGEILRLYVTGRNAKAEVAIANLRRFCEEHLAGRYSIEVIDLMENPKLARTHDIVAIPTLVRSLPAPMRKIIGDLSNRERVLVGFDLRSDS